MTARVEVRNVTVIFDILTASQMNLKRLLIGRFANRVAVEPYRITALHDVGLTVVSGERIHLAGPNGAGKTTLLRVVAGILAPNSGTVRVAGRMLSLLGGASSYLDPGISGRDNIIQLGIRLGESRRSIIRKLPEIVEFSGLSSRISTAVGTYSSGMAARLRFSTITALRPQVLLIDEGIASSADTEFYARSIRRLKEFQDSIEIVLLASHSLPISGDFRTIELQNGRFVE